MSLVAFSSKTKSCKVELVGGHSVELTFRPFTLADLSWMQDTFTDEQDQLDIAAMKAAPLCKIIWNQLTNETKKLFSDVTFKQYNEDTEEEEDVKLIGYQKLLHSIKDNENMIIAFVAYSEVQNINSFIPDQKKKTMKKAV